MNVLFEYSKKEPEPMKISQENIKTRILNTSAKIFAKYGIAKTTIDDIAKAVNMGKSSLYYYFKNKEEIFKAVIHAEIEEFGTKIRQAVADASSPQDKLRIFAVNRMRSLKELTNAYSALKDEYLTEYAFIQELREEYDRRETALIRSILEEGVKAGLFSITDVDMTSKVFITALKGFEYEWLMKENAPEDIEANVDGLLTVFYNGILK
jgi:AcrR family transcriptional regulator